MGKFHVNNEGVVSKCKTKPGNCPFGSDFEHFNSPEKARKYYELKNQVKVLKNFTKNKKLIIPLNSVMDINLLNEMVSEGYVHRAFHEDDDSLQILSYSCS